MEDDQLLAAWQAGDADAGDTLVSRYFAPICRFFRSKLGDDVDDLIQRTFLDCLHNGAGFRGEGSFRSWLFSIAYRRLYDHFREHAGSGEQADVGSRSLQDLRTSPSRAIARTQDMELVQRALELIAVDHRVVLELAYWEDLSGPEIAIALDIPANTVRSRLARARAALRERIDELAQGTPLDDARIETLTRAIAEG